VRSRWAWCPYYAARFGLCSDEPDGSQRPRPVAFVPLRGERRQVRRREVVGA
jgi:hypothetical protein